MPAHSLFDHILFAVLLVLPLIEWRFTWPQFLARLASGEPGVRIKFYRATVLSEWLAVLCLIGFWSGRPWAWLLLGPSTPLRLIAGFAGAGIVIFFLRWQHMQVLKSDEATARVRRQLQRAEPLLPHTSAERRLFRVLSVTAGVCEETLFRGFLFWYLAVWTGPTAAVILSSIVFGAGHVYLGANNFPKTALAGVFFACVAIASGSLWPAIVMHAAVDWNSGELAYRILARPAASAT